MGQFHFDCVFHVVSDLDRAISFYRDTLGFVLTSRDVVARFEIDGVLFEAVPANKDHGLKPGGSSGLCLEVDDISEARKELDRKGLSVGDTWDVSGGKLASFADPDGNEIFLWQSSRS